MKLADLNSEEKRYNDESNLLDSLYEFHPDFFNELDSNERKVMGEYYLVGKDMPENVFEYRKAILSQDPNLKEKGEQTFEHLMDIAGIKR